jgi:hypothetical protein
MYNDLPLLSGVLLCRLSMLCRMVWSPLYQTWLASCHPLLEGVSLTISSLENFFLPQSSERFSWQQVKEIEYQSNKNSERSCHLISDNEIQLRFSLLFNSVLVSFTFSTLLWIYATSFLFTNFLHLKQRQTKFPKFLWFERIADIVVIVKSANAGNSRCSSRIETGMKALLLWHDR